LDDQRIFSRTKDIKVEAVRVAEKGAINVKKRKLIISVWDHNTVDGDIISLKLGEEWILTNYNSPPRNLSSQSP
jgi:hypothetical protein